MNRDLFLATSKQTPVDPSDDREEKAGLDQGLWYTGSMLDKGGHDVSDQPRDEGGRWTTAGGATTAPEHRDAERFHAERAKDLTAGGRLEDAEAHTVAGHMHGTAATNLEGAKAAHQKEMAHEASAMAREESQRLRGKDAQWQESREQAKATGGAPEFKTDDEVKAWYKDKFGTEIALRSPEDDRRKVPRTPAEMAKRLDVARRCADMLADVKAAGDALPKQAKITGFIETGRGGTRMIPVSAPAAVEFPNAGYSEPVLTINPNAFLWHNSNSMGNAHKAAWFSSDKDAHPVTHEMGHYNHWVDAQKATGGSVQFSRMLIASSARSPALAWAAVEPGAGARAAMRTAEKVSGYAGSDPMEFVAETYAGMVAGKKYPAEVMDLYRKVGGHVRKEWES